MHLDTNSHSNPNPPTFIMVPLSPYKDFPDYEDLPKARDFFEFDDDTDFLNAFHLLTFFFRFGYYLLLIPFRFKRDKKSGIYFVATNQMQKVFSTLLVTMAFISGFLDLRHMFDSGLLSRPEKAFMWSYALLLKIFYVPTWFLTFWGRRDKFENLLEFCQSGHGGRRVRVMRMRPKRVWLHFIIAIVVFSELKLLFEQILDDAMRKGGIGTLKFYGGICMYNLRLRDDDDPLSDEELMGSSFTFTASILYTIAMNVFRHVELIFELFVLLSALTVYYVCTRFVKGLEKRWKGSEVIQKYQDFTALLDLINGISGPVVFVYLIGMVPTFVWCVFGVFEEQSFDICLYFVHKMSIHLIILIVAAEAQSKSGDLTGWIMQRVASSSTPQWHGPEMDRFQVFLNFAHREATSNPFGLKAFKFFTVSYGFLGVAVSTIVTYAVIMLQFQVENYKKGLNHEEFPTCNCSTEESETY